jgi:uncharacterized protein YeaO (DUF488 family)
LQPSRLRAIAHRRAIISDVEVRTKRVQQKPSPDDGYRVLVDRLWPRGVSQDKARLDEWMPDVAPSAELRQWFGHEPERFAEFGRRYREELKGRRGLLTQLRRRAREGTLTLLYAAKDTEHNNAVVLAEALRRGLR